jgi:hypothetical protein
MSTATDGMEMVSISDMKHEKDVFIGQVKRWVLLDTHLKHIHEKTKELKEERSTLEASICSYLAKRNMREKKIEIHDGEIRCVERKEYTPLSYSYLEDTLSDMINEVATVERIITYLKQQRKVKTHIELRRTYVTKETI